MRLMGALRPVQRTQYTRSLGGTSDATHSGRQRRDFGATPEGPVDSDVTQRSCEAR